MTALQPIFIYLFRRRRVVWHASLGARRLGGIQLVPRLMARVILVLRTILCSNFVRKFSTFHS